DSIACNTNQVLAASLAVDPGQCRAPDPDQQVTSEHWNGDRGQSVQIVRCCRRPFIQLFDPSLLERSVTLPEKLQGGGRRDLDGIERALGHSTHNEGEFRECLCGNMRILRRHSDLKLCRKDVATAHWQTGCHPPM